MSLVFNTVRAIFAVKARPVIDLQAGFAVGDVGDVEGMDWDHYFADVANVASPLTALA